MSLVSLITQMVMPAIYAEAIAREQKEKKEAAATTEESRMPDKDGMMEWQPIETAPKDDLVLLSDGFTVGEGFWHDGSECYGHRGIAGWFWESDRANLLIASNAHATHWMPLPPPPEQTK